MRLPLFLRILVECVAKMVDEFFEWLTEGENQ